MSNQHRVETDFILIQQKENLNKFPCHFDVIFRCNVNGQKIEVVLAYSVWRNFDEQNIDVVLIYFFDLILMDEKSMLLWCIFLVQFRWKADVTAHILMCFERQKIVVVLIQLFDIKFLI